MTSQEFLTRFYKYFGSVLQQSESQKEDPFSMAEPQVDLHASRRTLELVQEGNLGPAPNSFNDKASMAEYSKYLQQAFEKSTNAGFTLGPRFWLSACLHLHCAFIPRKTDILILWSVVLEASLLPQVFAIFIASLLLGCCLGLSQVFICSSALDATHQQLTPSQELDDLIRFSENLEASSAFQSSSQKLTSQKEQQKNLESSASFQIPSQELASQIDPQKSVEPRATYQIENFAQAFGSQFKSGSRVPMTFITNS